MSDVVAVQGLHHVTAIGSDPQPNLDFYVGVLGLRLVKKTVNFDDPTTYHLYYGDAVGTPGTIVTFFPWPGAHPGRRGIPQCTVTQFAVPPGSLGAWQARLAERAVALDSTRERFGRPVLTLEDPDGLALELVESDAPPVDLWDEGPVPADVAIRGFHGVTLEVGRGEATAGFLTDVMGLQLESEEGEWVRFATEGEPRGIVDVRSRPSAARGVISAGTVHHVAWRVASDSDQEAWRQRLVDAGREVTRILDRNYFRSIYFREPGGVLFEFATDGPGFTVDESRDELGSGLRLPKWYEPERDRLEKALPPLRSPSTS